METATLLMPRNKTRKENISQPRQISFGKWHADGLVETLTREKFARVNGSWSHTLPPCDWITFFEARRYAAIHRDIDRRYIFGFFLIYAGKLSRTLFVSAVRRLRVPCLPTRLRHARGRTPKAGAAHMLPPLPSPRTDLPQVLRALRVLPGGRRHPVARASDPHRTSPLGLFAYFPPPPPVTALRTG